MKQVKIKNLSRIEKKLIRLQPALVKPLQRTVFLSAELVRKTAIKGISKGARSGQLYTRGNKQARRSSPGEYPKTDRGTLVKSIFNRSLQGYNKIAFIVGTRLKYGQNLEFGTSIMRPRPWLFPSFKSNVKKIKKDIRRSVLEALKKGRRL